MLPFCHESQWLGSQQRAGTTHGINSDHYTLGIVFSLQRTRDTSDGPTGPSTRNEYVHLSGRRA